MDERTEQRQWVRVLRFVAVAAAAGFVIYALGPGFKPRKTALKPAGERPPLGDFVLSRLGGGEWRLAGHKGHVLLLNFWATWCAPCRAETPELVNVHSRYQARGFQVIGISLDENTAAIPPFIKRYQVPYPILLPGADFSLAAQVESIPTSVLLDRQGRVAAVYHGAVGEEDLSSGVELLLQEQ
jgi:thiol-disulfide isomerase/thioredoxin